ncbi:MAG TPA: excisionase family DNA-binding protein [Thermoanaerobaculaceae bacterium]|nr:excisionase family DNA-binding protein [Thermoanaerobaculaceae bacterium]
MAQLMTIKETAARMSAREDHVRQLIKGGVLDGVVVRLGRLVRVNADRLEQWIDNGGAALPGGWRRGTEASGGK